MWALCLVTGLVCDLVTNRSSYSFRESLKCKKFKSGGRTKIRWPFKIFRGADVGCQVFYLYVSLSGRKMLNFNVSARQSNSYKKKEFNK